MDIKVIRESLSSYRPEMTPEERIRSYRQGDEVDHLPFSLIGPDLAIARGLGYAPENYGDSSISYMVEKKKRDYFGLSSISMDLSLRGIGIALGSMPGPARDGIDYIQEFAVDDYSSLDKIRSVEICSYEPFIEKIEKVHHQLDSFPGSEVRTGVAGPFSTAAALRPVELLMRDTKKRPERLRQLFDICVEKSVDWVRMFCSEFGNVPVDISDPVTSASLIGLSTFEEFSFPYLKQLVDEVSSITTGGIRLHICGKTRLFWPYFRKLNIATFSLDNCEDMEDAKHELGDKLELEGNVPPVDVLKFGSVDDVISSVKDCIKKASDSPSGYVVNSGCMIPPSAPLSNIEAFVFAVRKYGRLARKGSIPEGLTG